MVTKKKKTKPAANPARGFATTSVASKPKPERIDIESSNDASETASPAVAAAEPEQNDESKQTSSDSADNKAPAKELHELSPEEFEAQMELSDLQNVIEQQAPKVKKESARQVSRLQTERRVLRAQAELLTVRDWLPDELMQQIVDLAIEEEQVNAANGSPVSLKKFSEDELVSRIWQLHLTLADLDISEQQTAKALQYILTNPPVEENGSCIWGLAEVFDWLAIHGEPGEMLDYDTSRPKPQSNGTHMTGKSLTSHSLHIISCTSFYFLLFALVPDFPRSIAIQRGWIS